MSAWLLLGSLLTSMFSLGGAELNATMENQACEVILADNQTMSEFRQSFVDTSQDQTVVYFSLRVIDDQTGNVTPFEAGNISDTFEPDLWLWTTAKGKALLRLPLDFQILSLGLLTINSASLIIDFTKASADCLGALPGDKAINIIASFLASNTGNESLQSAERPFICRSAYVFGHNILGSNTTGYRCCSLSNTSTAQNPRYECNSKFTGTWERIWFAPIVLLCWVYAITFLYLWKRYRDIFGRNTIDNKIHPLTGISGAIDDIKEEVEHRIEELSKRIAGHTDTDLISLREPFGYLDVLGVDDRHKVTLGDVLIAIVVFVLFSSYYAVYATLLYQFHTQVDKESIRRLDDTLEIYMNVVGHFGWLFCRPELYIFRYAVFEAVYTLLVPLIVGMLYWSVELRTEAKQLERASSSKLPATVERVQANHRSAIRGRLVKFVDSTPGTVFMVTCFLSVILFVICVAGPFLAYCVFFVGLGVFAHMEVIAPWIVPFTVCLSFLATAFSPVTKFYTQVKDRFFGICLKKFKDIVVHRNDEIFLPRQLIEMFYKPRSRPVIYASVQRVMIVLTLVIMLTPLIMTIPTESISEFLGVQVVFILPLLVQSANNGQTMSPLEQQILTRDIVNFIRQYKQQQQQQQQHDQIVNTDGDDNNSHGNDEDTGDTNPELITS